jgi:kumamolisin
MGPADPTEILAVGIRVRRRPDAPQLPTRRRAPLSREDFAARYGADPADLERVAAFARARGLNVMGTSVPRRMVDVSGTAEQMGRAFAVDLGRYESSTEAYRGREGSVHLPGDLMDVVQGVFGLDNRRMARPASARAAGREAPLTLLTPPQVASLYNFPTPPDATGQTIGLLEFGGGCGYFPGDIQAFFAGLNLPTPLVTPVSVDGVTNSPGRNNLSLEVTLHIDVAGSVAPRAKIAVYFAPWTQLGWVHAVTTAIHDATNAPSVLCISAGWAELENGGYFAWTPAAMTAVSETFAEAAALGVTVLVASGDTGTRGLHNDGKAHVDYPASDPWVTACGGTSIENVAGSAFAEVTWNDAEGVTGGGISDFWAVPDWQELAGVPPSVNDGHHGRGIPDIAGTVYPLSADKMIFDGQPSPGFLTGSTGAVAPLYAGLVALLNANFSANRAGAVGFLNPLLYAVGDTRGVFRDIHDGVSNAGTSGWITPGYTAGVGWDACTGWGSINGQALLGLALVPDCTEAGLRDARRQLAMAGLKVGKVRTLPPLGPAPYSGPWVIAENPDAGTLVDRGSKVDLTLQARHVTPHPQ